jgi:NADH:ubiquinone oxidoreductase subunit 6 (subunit J)
MLYNNYFSYSTFGPGFWTPLALLGALWFLIVIVLKGYALWHAAKRNEKWWFVALLILNTAGILELVYIICILKDWPGKPPMGQTHTHNHNPHHSA